jgi:3D (Asp-Asp-Asp) domain-containing protein
MHKRLQKIAEEIIPLSSKQNLVLLLLVSCIFQFLFFAMPTLAAAPDNNDISLGQVNQTVVMDANAQVLMIQANPTSTPAMITPATTTPNITEPVTAGIATTTEVKAPVVKPKIIKTSVHTITAYNSEVAQTDNSPCITANGFNVCQHNQEDTIAANFLKFGTKVKIPELFGDKIFVVRDRMNAKHQNRIDIWMKNRTSALKFGVKISKIEVLGA